MYIIEEKMHTYVLVLKKASIGSGSSEYQIEKVTKGK